MAGGLDAFEERIHAGTVRISDGLEKLRGRVRHPSPSDHSLGGAADRAEPTSCRLGCRHVGKRTTGEPGSVAVSMHRDAGAVPAAEE